MLDTTKVLLEDYNSEFKGYLSFVEGNNWEDNIEVNKNGDFESEKLNTEVSIIKTVISGTNRFIEDVEDDFNLKPVQELLSLAGNIIKKHIEKLQEFKKTNPLTESSTQADVQFHADVFDHIVKAKAGLVKLDLSDKSKSPEIFYGNVKAPLLMRESLTALIPSVKDRVDGLDINFGASVINPATHNEMFINMKDKDIPKWDVNKHFYDQEKSTIEFWEEELRKCKDGVNVGGYHISGWLYWHLNHFKLAFGSGHNKKVSNPHFRDNEYYFDQMIRRAKEHGRKGVFQYGTRRFAKSVNNASYVNHALYTVPNCKGSILGFSEKPDLEAMVDYTNEFFTNVEPAFKLPMNNIDFTNGIQIGLKGKKVQLRYDHAKLLMLNLDGGTNKLGTQKGAGGTPDVFVIVEAGKGPVIPIWNAARPSFADNDSIRWRCVPLLDGTAGEGELSKDAETMLKDPDTYDILPMDWDLLDSMVPDPEYITWRREKFGMFVPAQMSLEGPPKLNSNFAEFLKLPQSHPLSQIQMKVTDWEANNEFYKEQRNLKKNDISTLASYTNSYPLQVEDCYMSTQENIFPGLECKNRINLIKEEGLTGQTYRLINSNGVIRSEMVNEPLITDYPFKGGVFDAPIVMVDNPLLDGQEPPLGLYTMGVDDIKFSGGSKDSDSVFSATIFKRGYEGGEWANRFVAWYDTRPNNKKTAYEQAYLLMKIFNARVLYENNDSGFLEYVEDNHPEDVYKHFSQGIGIASESNLNYNSSRKFGWMATAQNIYRLTQSLVRYTKSENNVVGDRQNLSGVDLINHPMLLEEMYRYKPKQNADRLRSAGLALILGEYYDRTYNYMKKRSVSEKEKKKREDKMKKFETFGGLSDVSALTIW